MFFRNCKVIYHLWILRIELDTGISTAKRKLCFQFSLILLTIRNVKKTEKRCLSQSPCEVCPETLKVIMRFLPWTKPLYVNSSPVQDVFWFWRFYSFRRDYIFFINFNSEDISKMFIGGCTPFLLLWKRKLHKPPYEYWSWLWFC